jgi:sterol desaturase/sphingolipid hydroxylase (fatty acid hydroxylase superfamily)
MDWISAHRLIDLTELGPLGGARLAVVVDELIGNVYHRAMHHSSVLWRIHQLHHGAERAGVYGSAYIHPVEIVGTSLIGSIGATLVLGVSADAAALAGFAMVACATFQHANIPIPVWLGYIRNPEHFEADDGLWDGASPRVGAMLAGLDNTAPPAPLDTQQPA